MFNLFLLGMFLFGIDNDIICGLLCVFLGFCCIRIENGCFRSVLGVFCVSFGLFFWLSFSIWWWGCSSFYYRFYFWYYGNMCLFRSVCKKVVRSMMCYFKLNLFWIERGSGFWEFIVDIFILYIWNFIFLVFFIWLSFIFFVDIVVWIFCFYFDVGNSVFGGIDLLDNLNNLRIDWCNIWIVMNMIDDVILNVVDWKEIFVNMCMILFLLWIFI